MRGHQELHIARVRFKQPTDIRFDKGGAHLRMTDLKAATIVALNPSTGAVETTTRQHGGVSDPAAGIAVATGPAY